MVNTVDLSTIKMLIFISIETFRSKESTLSYSIFSMTPVKYFFFFLTTIFIESQPVRNRVLKDLYMDCFDTMLAYANILTFFYETLSSKFKKKYQ